MELRHLLSHFHQKNKTESSQKIMSPDSAKKSQISTAKMKKFKARRHSALLTGPLNFILKFALFSSLLPLSRGQNLGNYGGPGGGNDVFGPNSIHQGPSNGGGPSGLSGPGGPLDLWQTERPKDMARIVDLEVMCGKQHMEVQLTFDKPFNGIVFSKGAVDRYDCIYVKPQTGLGQYKFDIMYDSCGSKPDLNGRFYENNIVIQYDKDLIEVWDEAKRLRCEWYNDYEKGVTKPPIRVSDLDVVELNFRGDNVDCWMEIQQGKGPWASPVAGIVPLGTTLTMVIGIDDKQGEFDMRVKSCAASDGQNRPIDLSDENGCVLRPKMISKFMKMRSTDARATVVTYAFFHAFKFPDTMAVQIRCKVEICRYGCPDHCQAESLSGYNSRETQVSSSINNNQQQYNQPSLPQPVYNGGPQGFPQYNRRADENAEELDIGEDLEGSEELLEDEEQQSVNALPPQGPALNKRPPPGPPGVPQGKLPRPPKPRRTNRNFRRRPPLLPPRINNPFLRESARTGYAPMPLLDEKMMSHRTLALDDLSEDDYYEDFMETSESRQFGSHHQNRRLQQPYPQRQPQRQQRPGSNRREDDGNLGITFLGMDIGLPKMELPKLSLPNFFGGDDGDDIGNDNLVDDEEEDEQFYGNEENVKSEAIPVSLGRLPSKDALKPKYIKSSAVPVSRTSNNAQPLVYPSSFVSGGQPVVPLESLNSKTSAKKFPYGPRSLNIEPLEEDESSRSRRKRSPAQVLRRSKRSADVGVVGGYEVVSEVDLDFNPHEQNGVAVLKGRIRSEEIIYGVCLPATGFAALFVLVSLLTVISVIVSGFVCYRRQLQRVAEENAPALAVPGTHVMKLPSPPKNLPSQKNLTAVHSPQGSSNQIPWFQNSNQNAY